jgi:hypothetical protein
MDIDKETLAESGIKVGQTFSVDVEDTLEKHKRLVREIDDIDAHIKALSQFPKPVHGAFITINNDCIGISGNYSDEVRSGIKKIIHELRSKRAAVKLQLFNLTK